MVEESGLDKLVRMSKEHAAAYRNVLGYLAMTWRGAVQLSEPCYLDRIPGSWEVRKLVDVEYPYHISKHYKGVEFFVVATTEGYEAWNGEGAGSW